ncbi:hypothetical protein [Soonwooa sp.]|uniref:hypothetical protein n=1 Tax=Soonwooa sp. TaxID=1938592 RepID=UPI00289D3864|nr:hypothetical protein [Soonwooa sp.]
MKPNKKILFIYYKLFKPGGVARVLTSLANELCEAGYDVSILVLMANDGSFFHLDPRIKFLKLTHFRTGVLLKSMLILINTLENYQLEKVSKTISTILDNGKCYQNG